ncbi:hypothetical protein NLI96_g3300 [Meripilus lineatus]|uniref:Uncharacterized protein n=1 Tax=Meripilus lineatus TaxID=2056292 RepID=A0AAD5YFR4_9APHY|nr:hypothetical protein NLI96_g3300 [Physisporinus lineatus]
MKRVSTLQTSVESLTKTTLTLIKAFENVSRAVEVQNKLLAQAGLPTLAQTITGHPGVGAGAPPVIPAQSHSYQVDHSGQHTLRVPQRSLASTTMYTPPIQPGSTGISGGSVPTQNSMLWNYRGALTTQPDSRDHSYSVPIPYDSSAIRQGPTTPEAPSKQHFVPNYPTLPRHDVSRVGPSTIPTSGLTSPSATLSTTSSLPSQDEVPTYAMDEPTASVDASNSIIPGLALQGLLSSTSMQTQATEDGSGKMSKNRKRRYKNREKKRLALARTLEHSAKRQQLQ